MAYTAVVTGDFILAKWIRFPYTKSSLCLLDVSAQAHLFSAFGLLKTILT